MTLFVAALIPCLTILVANIIIIYGVRKAGKERGKISEGKGSSAKENSLTRMLILLSVAFIIFCVPYAVGEVILKLPEVAALYDLSDPYWKLRLSVISYALSGISALNKVVNFYLYIAGGKNITGMMLERYLGHALDVRIRNINARKYFIVNFSRRSKPIADFCNPNITLFIKISTKEPI